MTDREKLIDLIRGTPDVKVWPDAGGKIADHLIANGVTVQECGGCDICNTFISDDTDWKFCPFCGKPIK